MFGSSISISLRFSPPLSGAVKMVGFGFAVPLQPKCGFSSEGQGVEPPLGLSDLLRRLFGSRDVPDPEPMGLLRRSRTTNQMTVVRRGFGEVLDAIGHDQRLSLANLWPMKLDKRFVVARAASCEQLARAHDRRVSPIEGNGLVCFARPDIHPRCHELTARQVRAYRQGELTLAQPRHSL